MNGDEPTGQNPPEQEQDDYAAAAKAMEQEHVGPKYHKDNGSKHNIKKIIIPIIIVVVASAIIVGVYFAFFKSKSTTAPTDTTQSAQSQSQATETTDTKHFDSDNFNLGFDYPSDWKVVDSAGSGKLTVTSPAVKLKKASGQQVDGQIIMTIRDKSQKLTEFDKGNALAATDSEKINYSKPSGTQRGSTYISFLTYASSDVSGGLDGIYITGDSGYKKEQAVPMVDISKVDPVINITFSESGKPLTIGLSSWNNTSFSKPLKSLLQSLAIQ